MRPEIFLLTQQAKGIAISFDKHHCRVLNILRCLPVRYFGSSSTSSSNGSRSGGGGGGGGGGSSSNE